MCRRHRIARTRDAALVRARFRLRRRLVRVPDDRRCRGSSAIAARATATRGCRTSRASTPYGDTWGRFGLSFYIYALLFVAFDIEVVFIYLWALVFRDLLLGGFVSMLLFVGILLLGLGYAWRKGVLTWQ